MTDPVALASKIRETLAPRGLGVWPTPLEEAPALAAPLGVDALWIKREDRSAPAYGGNKLRALEFLLGGPRPAGPGTACVTVGGTGSTHCLATAVHAARLGCRVVLAQFPQYETDPARAVARATVARADLVVRAGSRAALPLAVGRAWWGARRLGRPRWVPGGGAHPRGVVGQFLGGLELAGQLPEPPDAIVAPVGTTGTTAGLALAVRWLGWPTRVIGVRVAPLPVSHPRRAAWLGRGARRLLATHGIRIPAPEPVLSLDGLGAGYGRPTPAGEAARRLAAAHGLALDPAYGAKTLAALPDVAARGFRRVLFWHTFAPAPAGAPTPAAEDGA